MANVGTYGQQHALDFLNRSNSAAPAGAYVALTTAVGTSSVIAGVGELPSGSGYQRVSASWAAAIGPPYSAYNLSAMTFGPLSGACTISGIYVLDSSAQVGTGNIVWYGSLQTARNPLAGDSIVIGTSALTSLIA